MLSSRRSRADREASPCCHPAGAPKARVSGSLSLAAVWPLTTDSDRTSRDVKAIPTLARRPTDDSLLRDDKEGSVPLLPAG